MQCTYWLRTLEHTDIMSEGYVGISQDFESRMERHKHYSAKEETPLGRAIRKYEWDNLIKEIVFEAESREAVSDKEKELRPNANTGWNISVGGDSAGMRGLNHTPETKAKISSKNSGTGNPMHGKDWRDFASDETIKDYKENISKAMKGSNNPMYGKPCTYAMSEERVADWKRNLSKAGESKGKDWWNRRQVKHARSEWTKLELAYELMRLDKEVGVKELRVILNIRYHTAKMMVKWVNTHGHPLLHKEYHKLTRK